MAGGPAAGQEVLRVGGLDWAEPISEAGRN